MDLRRTHFVMHLGIVGVACAWKAADPTNGGISAPAAVYYTISVWAAIWYFIWVVLYVFKIFLYPKKVRWGMKKRYKAEDYWGRLASQTHGTDMVAPGHALRAWC